jgi:hypothetical protein
MGCQQQLAIDLLATGLLRFQSFLSGSLVVLVYINCQTEARVIFGMACQTSTYGYDIVRLAQYLWEMSILDADSHKEE